MSACRLLQGSGSGLAALLALLGGLWMPAPAAAAEQLAVPIVYVTRQEGAKLPPASLLEPRELKDEGLAGATRGIADNQTTGGFLGHAYTLSELIVPEDGDVVAAVKERLADGERFFVATCSPTTFLPSRISPRRRVR